MRWKTLALFLALFSTAHAQWQLQNSQTSADLRGIHALSDEVAWASGSGGTVLRTTDGGATWIHCATPPGAEALDLRGVQAFNANTALVMSSGKGNLSRIYKTVDACRTWQLVLTNPDPEGRWDSIQFQFNPGVPPNKGYFAGGVLIGHALHGEFPIFTSRDYGSTWKALREDEAYSPGPQALAREGERLFDASNSAVTTTADDNTFAFVTGGEGGGRLVFPQGRSYDFNYVSTSYTFSTIQLPMPANATSGGFSIAARHTSRDRVDLMIVGGDSSNPQVGSAVLVRRGGAGLKKLLPPKVVASAHPPHGYRTAVAYDAPTNSWITVGPNGTDVSHDDGRTWVSLNPGTGDPPDSSQKWQALSLPFVVGPGGRIGRLRRDTTVP